MRIIISPAKNMTEDLSDDVLDQPVFLAQAEKIRTVVKAMSLSDCQKMWKCSEKLAVMNYERFQTMDLHKNQSPAVYSYTGLQYKYMAPGGLDDKGLAYLQKNLRILSGFYGCLRPFDGIVPYRMEMQTVLSVDGKKDLYEFWGDSLYKEVCDDSGIIVNLASYEYSQCIEKYLKTEDHMITVVFGEVVKGKVVKKGTLAKMARGETVSLMAENQVEDISALKMLRPQGFVYDPALSSESEFVYINQKRE